MADLKYKCLEDFDKMNIQATLFSTIWNIADRIECSDSRKYA